ncbi:hypothetical protein BGZ83_009081 [Gryganskiella cystojenkinii]|nr:hypothetical protein BGZ83_009081 [Gryganskiella cystojenkinii]
MKFLTYTLMKPTWLPLPEDEQVVEDHDAQIITLLVFQTSSGQELHPDFLEEVMRFRDIQVHYLSQSDQDHHDAIVGELDDDNTYKRRALLFCQQNPHYQIFDFFIINQPWVSQERTGSKPCVKAYCHDYEQDFTTSTLFKITPQGLVYLCNRFFIGNRTFEELVAKVEHYPEGLLDYYVRPPYDPSLLPPFPPVVPISVPT